MSVSVFCIGVGFTDLAVVAVSFGGSLYLFIAGARHFRCFFFTSETEIIRLSDLCHPFSGG